MLSSMAIRVLARSYAVIDATLGSTRLDFQVYLELVKTRDDIRALVLAEKAIADFELLRQEFERLYGDD